MGIGKAAEFFAGIGLVRLATEQAGWKTVFANDINANKQEMYVANFGNAEFKLDDIGTLTAVDIPEVSLATASFPCIDLSLAGNREGLKGEHSSTYWEFHRILRDLKGRRPQFILLENVIGLLSSHGGQDLREIVASLSKLDYACDLLLVDAVHFLPQSRPRLFLIGFRGMDGDPVRDVEIHSARPEAIVNFMRANDDLRWLFTEVPELPSKQKNLPAYAERISDESPDWWDRNRRDHLWRQMSSSHKEVLKYLLDGSRPKFATVYKRVRPSGCRAEVRADGIAGCLRTPRGGSSKQFIIQAQGGDWRVRNMTAREYARLQGAPDYKITVPYTQALFGFGDAVCVPAVEWVIRNTINAAVPTAAHDYAAAST
ncbi:MAG: DNA cytosine methyltransferase [Vicinamibacterales bacterium]